MNHCAGLGGVVLDVTLTYLNTSHVGAVKMACPVRANRAWICWPGKGPTSWGFRHSCGLQEGEARAREEMRENSLKK